MKKYLFSIFASIILGFNGVSQAPTIASFSPSSGSAGSVVTIIGTNLDNPTAFSIGGVNAIIISNTGNTLVGMVMPGATTGLISMTTSTGTANSTGSFVVSTTSLIDHQESTSLSGNGYILYTKSVSISADGNTAIIGYPEEHSDVSKASGAAFIYTISNGVWSQQGSILKAPASSGSHNFGYSVALSADGNTAIVGDPSDNNFLGAIYIFTRSNGVWNQQGNKLVGSGVEIGSQLTHIAYQGSAVALSADGNTAIVGGPEDRHFDYFHISSLDYYDTIEVKNYGAAWVFTRNNGTWTQQGGKLIGSGSVGESIKQGVAVSISADGNTALVGGNHDDSSRTGATWVFTRSGGIWTQQGNKLVGSGSIGNSNGVSVNQGITVSLSADGNTAVVGGNFDNNNTGAVWVFTRSGNIWSQQGNKLVGTDIYGIALNKHQGNAVSISGDGNTIIVGGYATGGCSGGTWIYTRSGGLWSQNRQLLEPSGGTACNFGICLSLTYDGKRAIIGSDYSGSVYWKGAWIYKSCDFATVPSVSASSTVNCGTQSTSLNIISGSLNENNDWYWYTNSCGGSSLNHGTTINVSPANTTTYYVRGGGACLHSIDNCASITITVKDKPTITSTSPSSRCGAGTLGISATASAGTLNWYTASTGGTSLATGTNFSTPTLSNTTTYFVDATFNGCTSARTAVAATVNYAPTVNAGSFARCGTGTLSLTANASAGVLNWYTAASGGSFLGTGTNIISPSISSTTNFYVDATNNGCISSRTAVPAIVYSLPTVTASATNPNVCSGNSTSLFGGGATSYAWSDGKVNGVSFIPASTTTYTVTGTGGNGCTNTATQTITVIPLPATPVVTVQNNSSNSILSTNAGGSLLWSNGATTPDITVTNAGTYTVTQTANGCMSLAGSGVAAPSNPLLWNPLGPKEFNQASLQEASYNSIAHDASGIPYIAYSDAAYGNKVTVKKYIGNEWIAIGDAGFSSGVANYVSLAIHSNGNVYVSYQNEGGDITVKKFNGSNWENVGSESFAMGQVDKPTLTIDGSGTPYVVYKNSNWPAGITVKKFNGSSWETVGTEDFSFSQIDYPSIAIDGNGIAYVAFQDYANNGNGNVMKFNGSNWETVGWSGSVTMGQASYTSLAFDHNNNLYFGYIDTHTDLPIDPMTPPLTSINPTLLKFDDNSQSWVTLGNVVPSYPNVVDCSISISADDTPYMVFYCYDSYSTSGYLNTLVYNGFDLQNAGNNIACIISSSPMSLFTGTVYPKISINNTGTPFLMYSDANNHSKASIMKLNNYSWENVENRGISSGTASNISIALNSDGTPYIAYVDDGINSKVCVKKYNGSSWETVGTNGFSSGGAYYTSIAISKNNVPFVVYADYANGSKATVKKFNGNSWETVGTEGFSTGYTSYTTISVDSNDIPYVAYTDIGNSWKAVVKKFNGSSWETVGVEGFSSESAVYLKLKIGKDNFPYVVYNNSNTYKPIVKKFNGSSWTSIGNEEFSTGNVYDPSLAFSLTGIPYVAFCDVANNYQATVKKFNGSIWETVGTEGFSQSTANSTLISFSTDGKPNVAFSDNSGKATVMKFNGTNWETIGSSAFSAGNASSISMAFNSEGTPFVALCDGGAWAYKYGSNCSNPVNGGSIADDQLLCSGSIPDLFSNTTTPNGQVGTLVYQWQSSNDNTTFSDINGATTAAFQAGALSSDTWFKRLAKASCQSQWKESNPVKITISPNGKSLQLKLYLSGLYNLGSNQMIEAIDGNTALPNWGNGIADKIDLELHQENDPYNLVTSINGVNLNTDGTANLNLACANNGNYYIAIKNRNHLETWSSVAIPFNTHTVMYDFTSNGMQAFGTDAQLQEAQNVFAIFTGDLNQSGYVDLDDFTIFEPDLTSGNIGFLITDINGSGYVDLDDFTPFEPRLTAGNVSQSPGHKR